ncbi:hypothetical protein [Azospirillum griseum]|uniref:hypothetical protein n=1 Tax=Azospirillum griseum TaxID=2496639 RepID=UPI001AEC7CDF|nr:hypothetical protein [Azospirillum griseum]
MTLDPILCTIALPIQHNTDCAHRVPADGGAGNRHFARTPTAAFDQFHAALPEKTA